MSLGYYGTPGAGPTRTTSFLYLSTAMRSFLTTVNDADMAPSPDVLKGFAAQEKNLEAAIQEWEKFKAGPLAEMNRKLTSENLSPLKTSE